MKSREVPADNQGARTVIPSLPDWGGVISKFSCMFTILSLDRTLEMYCLPLILKIRKLRHRVQMGSDFEEYFFTSIIKAYIAISTSSV